MCVSLKDFLFAFAFETCRGRMNGTLDKARPSKRERERERERGREREREEQNMEREKE